MRSVANNLLRASALFSLLGLTTAAHAEPVRLEDLEQRAVQNRASLVAARARVDVAEARVDVAKVPYYPTLSATAELDAAPGGRLIKVQDVSSSDSTPYTVSGSRTITEQGAFIPRFRYAGTMAFSSRLYDFGRTAASVRAARADRDATAAGVSAERQSIVVEVRAAYLGWLQAYGTRQILAESAADSAALRASVEAHVAAGQRPGAELASARYDEARAALDLERSESDLLAARLDVEQAAGLRLAKSAEPDVALLDRAPPANAVLSHPNVAAVERKRDAAMATAEAHAYPYAPIVGFDARAGVSGQTTTVFPLYQAGLTVTVPILDGGAESAARAVATAQASDLSAQARELRQRAEAGNERSRVAIERSGRRVALAEQLSAAAEQAVHHAEDQHALGSGTLDDIMTAKLRVSRAKLEVLNARLERARAVLDLSSTAQ
jgi:cobalt-zinc-cadmium efflux system outer membrane protein